MTDAISSAAALRAMPSLFTTWIEDAIARRTRREWALFALMGQRTLLMQIAHPLVARAVHDHSDFSRDPLRRFARTFDLSMKLFAGSEAQARRAAATINRAHGPVQGPGYRARDPRLGQWIFATLADSALVGHELFAGPLTTAEKQQMLDALAHRATLLGLRDLPATVPCLHQYIAHMIDTGAVRAGPLARQLAAPILRPDPLLLRPITRLIPAPVATYFARATLDPTLRAQYRLCWPLHAELTFTLLLCPLANHLLPRLTPTMACLQPAS